MTCHCLGRRARRTQFGSGADASAKAVRPGDPPSQHCFAAATKLLVLTKPIRSRESSGTSNPLTGQPWSTERFCMRIGFTPLILLLLLLTGRATAEEPNQ